MASTSNSCNFCRSPVSCISSPPKETYTCTLICKEHHHIPDQMPLTHKVTPALPAFALPSLSAKGRQLWEPCTWQSHRME